jgi:hypothetical protein
VFEVDLDSLQHLRPHSLTPPTMVQDVQPQDS